MTEPSGSSTASMVIQAGVHIPVGEDAFLAADIFTPSGGEPAPAILTMGPYGRNVTLATTYPEMWAALLAGLPEIGASSSTEHFVWERPDPERWTSWGYTVVNIDAPGTGDSPGIWSPMSPEESKQFATAVDWCGEQAWCTGKVGVLGVSFHAMAAWRVAAEQPRHLSAIIPWYGAGDAAREAWRHGGILSNAFLDSWWYRWVRNQYGAKQGTLDPDELAARRDEIPSLTREHELYDQWAAAQATDWASVTVPFLSVGNLGSAGLHLRGNVEAFRHASSKDKWLHLLATHGSGIDRFYSDAGLEVQRRFFDRFLKGSEDAWQGEPPVSCEVPGVRDSVDAVTGSQWPLEGVRFRRLYVDVQDGRLDERSAPDSTFRFWPSSDGFIARSAPLTDGARIVGPMSLRLQVATEAQDVDVFAYVSTVDSRGVPIARVGQGWLRLSHRELDDAASTPEQPVLAHRRLLDVNAGTTYQADVEIWPVSADVPRGGRLMLTVRGVDADDVAQFHHNDPDDRSNLRFAGWTTLHSGPSAESFLTVPFIE